MNSGDNNGGAKPNGNTGSARAFHPGTAAALERWPGLLRLRRYASCAVVTAALLGLNGCGLLTPSMIASLSTSVIGGLANGAVMGGSVIGTIRDKVTNARKDPEAEPVQSTANTALTAASGGVQGEACHSLRAHAGMKTRF